ncbi:MAG: NUDIX pyrophosphatase [Rhizobiaceae bacterium]
MTQDQWKPFQVLVIPYVWQSDGFAYCLFRRSDFGYLQGVAGGGEPGETPLGAAKRELIEEANPKELINIFQLKAMCSVPAFHFSHDNWPKTDLVIPEYSFGAQLGRKEVSLSFEHSEKQWLPYEEATESLKWDSNKTALWELNETLCELQQLK